MPGGVSASCPSISTQVEVGTSSFRAKPLSAATSLVTMTCREGRLRKADASEQKHRRIRSAVNLCPAATQLN